MCFKCSNCGTRLRIRTSSDATPTLRILYLECTNPRCRQEYSGTQHLHGVVRPGLRKFTHDPVNA